jgi:hypothetical protein
MEERWETAVLRGNSRMVVEYYNCGMVFLRVTWNQFPGPYVPLKLGNWHYSLEFGLTTKTYEILLFLDIPCG